MITQRAKVKTHGDRRISPTTTTSRSRSRLYQRRLHHHLNHTNMSAYKRIRELLLTCAFCLLGIGSSSLRIQYNSMNLQFSSSSSSSSPKRSIETSLPYDSLSSSATPPEALIPNTATTPIASLITSVAMALPPFPTLTTTTTTTDTTTITNIATAKTAPVTTEMGPKVVWLMSFPNSGTSFTGELIKQVTKSRTASNYGRGNYDGTGWSVPIHKGDYRGPFFVDPPKNFSEGYGVGDATPATPEVQYEDEHILTKTHCGGYCQVCQPNSYNMNITKFEDGCVITDRVWIDKESGQKVYEKSKYPLDKVKKAIHLIRDPFDNIVSRFHLEVHAERKRVNITSNNSTASLLDNSRDGFRKFCLESAERYATKEKNNKLWHQPGMAMLKKGIPCHADFFRWLQWHNLANQLTRQMNIPTYVLNYENFDTQFEQTLDEVLNFLGQSRKGKPYEFKTGKTYKDYFYPEEIRHVKEAMRLLATNETWPLIQHYFD